jgi:hypothetical protein
MDNPFSKHKRNLTKADLTPEEVRIKEGIESRIYTYRRWRV